jgi:hypothetical protein
LIFGTSLKVKKPKKAQAIKKRGKEPMREALFPMSGMVHCGRQPYVDEGAAAKKPISRSRMTALKAQAKELGYELLPSVRALAEGAPRKHLAFTAAGRRNRIQKN